MKPENYARTIIVKNTPEAAYHALTVGMENWWTKPDTPLSRLGDLAKFNFPPGLSFWTFEATVLIPNARVEMQCVKALHMHEGMPKEIEQEWLGTTVVWNILPKEKLTEITLEHIGLNSDLLCYDVCQAGWDFFFVDSLKSYLDTGLGTPNEYRD